MPNIQYLHRTILKAAVILLPLLGLTWLFGLLTLNDNATVFAWLFTIFNSLQVKAVAHHIYIKQMLYMPLYSFVAPVLAIVIVRGQKSIFL